MNASGYVETLGARLYYQDRGAGEPVLLLHGNAQSHRVFRWYLRQLSPLYRVLLMDELACLTGGELDGGEDIEIFERAD